MSDQPTPPSGAPPPAQPQPSQPPQTDSGLIVVTGDGTHTLVYRSIDVGGRTSPQTTATIKIDQTTPVVTCGSADGNWHG